MRTRRLPILAVSLAWGAWLPTAMAQAPRPAAYRPPSKMPRALIEAARRPARSAADSGTTDDREDIGVRRASIPGDSRPYLRESTPVTRPVSMPTRRNYFPTLRQGQWPNANAVNTAHLCVPGRRAFIYGSASR